MNKMLYVTNIHRDNADGIWNKIKYNLYSYQRLGFEVSFAYRNDLSYSIENGFNTDKSKETKIDCVHKDTYYYGLSKVVSNGNYDLVYIRKPIGGFSYAFLPYFLWCIKKNKNTKVILEIPTYPYKKEITTFRLHVSEFILNVSKLFFTKNIDLIVYMGDYSESIWGRPSLRIANAIDLEHVKPVKKNLKPLGNAINFVGVARLSFWHGYDRLIKAISSYKGGYKIRFKIVGDSEPEMSRLQELTKKLRVENEISFVGAKSGDELNLIYSESDVCVDSLGRHRSGSYYNSSLKSKEYAAKGLPFIKSHKDDSFNSTDFVYDVSADEGDIDLDAIIKWYQELPVDTPMKMRAYAERHLSWDRQCETVISYLSQDK